jgi:hypothetical protein
VLWQYSSKQEGFFEKIVVSAIIKQKNSRATYENFCFRHLNSMPRKKLMYVPGMISLLALPVMLLVFSPEDPVRKVALTMFLPSDEQDPPRDGILKFSAYSVNDAIKGKDLITIYLTEKRLFYGGFRDDEFNARLNFVAKEMERLQFTNDTNSVLRVVLDYDCEYADFVHLINLTLIYNIKRWAFVNDSFYFLMNPPPGRSISSSCYLSVDYSAYQGPTDWELFKSKMKYLMEEWEYYFRHNYALTGAFILLILLPGILGTRRIRKNFPALRTKPSTF